MMAFALFGIGMALMLDLTRLAGAWTILLALFGDFK